MDDSFLGNENVRFSGTRCPIGVLTLLTGCIKQHRCRTKPCLCQRRECGWRIVRRYGTQFSACKTLDWSLQRKQELITIQLQCTDSQTSDGVFDPPRLPIESTSHHTGVSALEECALQPTCEPTTGLWQNQNVPKIENQLELVFPWELDSSLRYCTYTCQEFPDFSNSDASTADLPHDHFRGLSESESAKSSNEGIWSDANSMATSDTSPTPQNGSQEVPIDPIHASTFTGFSNAQSHNSNRTLHAGRPSGHRCQTCNTSFRDFHQLR